MIFVTVGTTYYDELVREVDRLVAAGIIRDEVFAQIGGGTYVPSHLRWTRYLASLQPCYEQADLVIGHGGVGTVFEVMAIGKPFIAVANRSVANDHQADLLHVLEEQGWCVCCYGPEEVADALKRVQTRRRFVGHPALAEEVWAFLAGSPTAEAALKASNGASGR